MRKVFLCVLAVGLFLLAIGASLQARHKIAKNMARNDLTWTTDFDRWVRIVPDHLNHHADIVDDRFPNPPPVMLLIAPFTHLSRGNAATAWAFCKPLFALVIFVCGLQIVKNAGGKLSALAVGRFLAAWLWPVLGDMQGGQTNLLMLVPLAGALLAAQHESRRSQWLAGILLALAITIKVTPVIFLPYFMFRRRRWVVWGTVAGLFLWLFLVPSLFWGFEQNRIWLSDWMAIMVVPYAGEGHIREIEGSQSVANFFLRLLTGIPAFHAEEGGVMVPHYLNILNLPAAAVEWIVRGILATAALLGLAWIRKPLANFGRPRYLMEIGGIGLFMLWASHWTWVPHYVTMIFALLAVGMIYSDAAYSLAARRRAFCALLAADLLLFCTSDAPKVLFTHGGELSRVFSVALWAGFGLALVLVTTRQAEPLMDIKPLDSPGPQLT